MELAESVNNGDDQEGLYFELAQDIELGGKSIPWPTIGITIDNAAHQFRGVFDGCGHSITGMYVKRNDDDAGLFGYVGEGGVVRSVNVVDGDVSGTYWSGGIASRNYGLIEYCSFSCSVTGSQQFVGGIVGENHGGVLTLATNDDNAPSQLKSQFSGEATDIRASISCTR